MENLKETLEGIIKTTYSAYSANKSKYLKDIGMMAAANKHSSLLAIAKSIAVKLGANGPITIDHVTRELEYQGYTIKKANWLGSVFSKSEWVCVGSVESTKVSSHRRKIKLWATKAWLADNNMNGLNYDCSSFKLFNLYKQAKAANSDIDKNPDDYAFIIGEELLNKNLKATIVADNNKFCGHAALFMPGSYGVIFQSRAAIEDVLNTTAEDSQAKYKYRFGEDMPDDDKEVRVEVFRGVATVTHRPKNIKVSIVDQDVHETDTYK